MGNMALHACDQKEVATGWGTFVATQHCSDPQPDCPKRPSGPGTSALIEPWNVKALRTPAIDRISAERKADKSKD